MSLLEAFVVALGILGALILLLVVAGWLSRKELGTRGEVAEAPPPHHAVTEYLLEDLARAAGVLERGGSHEDLPLTVGQRLDLFRRAEDIYHHTSVPVIPGREEN